MKTLRIAGKRVTLTELGKEGDVEVLGATVQVKGLGKVSVRVEKVDPSKYQRLVTFLEVPRTATEIQKAFGLKTWSAAGRLVDAAKAAGVKLFTRTNVRPYLFSSKPIVETAVPARPADVLSAVLARLEALEERFTAPTHPSPPLSAPNLPPPSH